MSQLVEFSSHDGPIYIAVDLVVSIKTGGEDEDFNKNIVTIAFQGGVTEVYIMSDLDLESLYNYFDD